MTAGESFSWFPRLVFWDAQNTNICFFCLSDCGDLEPNYLLCLPRRPSLCHMITTPPQLPQESMQCQFEWQPTGVNELHTEPHTCPRQGQPATQKEGPKTQLSSATSDTAAAAAVWCCDIQGAIPLQKPQWLQGKTHEPFPASAETGSCTVPALDADHYQTSGPLCIQGAPWLGRVERVQPPAPQMGLFSPLSAPQPLVRHTCLPPGTPTPQLQLRLTGQWRVSEGGWRVQLGDAQDIKGQEFEHRASEQWAE